jgi:uncharacterized repeat protein (TIGR03803 family)
MYGMSRTSLSFFFLFAFALFAFAALMCASAAGQNSFKVIHSFSGYPNDGMTTSSSVVFDKLGNMYGATDGGGNQTGCGDFGCGTVYELSPDGQGNWTETILYNFCQNFDGVSCLDGASPNGLTIDSSGNLYGTTYQGGTGQQHVTIGAGIAFELSPPSQQGGVWTETVLHNFCSELSDGACLDGWVGVVGPLVLDKAGNLYGTTALGGTGHVKGEPSGGEGVVFKLARGVVGWEETVLHNFCTQGQGDDCPDGYQPGGGLSFSKTGDLYGTTAYSGNINEADGGSLFVLSPNGEGWKYKLLDVIPFNSQLYLPLSPIVFDAAGNLYSSLNAGNNNNGGLFRVDRKTRRVTLFKFDGSDGAGPGNVYIDEKENVLYGTTAGGGPINGGTIYSINAAGQESVLHSFCQQKNCTDGRAGNGLRPDGEGNLYGTSEFGGADGLGDVFEFTP